jgi:probable O-glycosylation ligase (exosortase A-associated)
MSVQIPASTWRPRSSSAARPVVEQAAPLPITAVRQPRPSIVTRAGAAVSSATAVLAAEPMLAWPFVVILAYFLSDFGRPQDWLPPLRVLRPGILTLGGGILGLIMRRQQIVLGSRAKLMFVFIGLMAIGTPLATNRYYAFLDTKDLLLFVLGAVLPIMNFVNTNDRLKTLVIFMVFIHIPLSFYSITHKGFGIGSFLGDENDFCLALNVITPFAFFSLFLAEAKWFRLFLIATLALFLFTITATLSRGGFVGLIAIAIACWLCSPRKAISLVGIAVLGVTVLAFVPTSYWDEMKTIETSTENDDTGAQRLYLWHMGWQMFLDNPILGVGPTNYQWNNYKYEDGTQADRGIHIWGKGAHSLYFTLLPELGVTGVAVFVSILVIGIRENRRLRRTYKQLQKIGASPELLARLYALTVYSRMNDVAVLGYMVTGAFLSVLYYPYFWLQAGLGVAIARVFDDTVRKEMAGMPGFDDLSDSRQPTSSLVTPSSRQLRQA